MVEWPQSTAGEYNNTWHMHIIYGAYADMVLIPGQQPPKPSTNQPSATDDDCDKSTLPNAEIPVEIPAETLKETPHHALYWHQPSDPPPVIPVVRV